MSSGKQYKYINLFGESVPPPKKRVTISFIKRMDKIEAEIKNNKKPGRND